MNGAISFLMVFKEKYTQAILSQGSGVLGIIISDSTKTDFTTKEYRKLTDVSSDDWKAGVYKYFEDLVFRGTPKKVIVYRIDEPADPETGYPDATHLKAPYDYLSKVTDYMVYPQGTETEQDALVGSVKNDRILDKVLNPFMKPIKLFTSTTTAPDSPYIINIKQKHTVNGTEYKASEYAVCLAGCACGIGLSGSLTYYKQSWVDAVEEVADIGEAVGDGYLVTVADTDGENLIYRTERGVNSFVTPTDNWGRTFSKIRLVEIMDQNLKDIQYTYKNYYIGKKKNTYANKISFCGAVNAYLKLFVKDGDLDGNYANKMDVDTEGNKSWALSNGKITEDEAAAMDEYNSRRINTKDQGFYLIKEYTPVDVMEDAEVYAEVI
jgi:hypothetical protein